MQEAMAGYFKRFATHARRAAGEHPLELILGVAIAALLSATTEDLVDGGWAVAMAGAAALAMVWLFGLSYLSRLQVLRPAPRWALSLAVIGVCALWGHLGLSGDSIAEVWRLGLMLTGAGAALLLIPLALREHPLPSSLRYLRMTYRLVTSLLTQTLYLGALWVGIALALSSLEALFDLHISPEIYAHLGAWIAGVGLPWMLATRTSVILELDTPAPSEEIHWFVRLGVYLALPLTALYLAITYAYAFRILLTEGLPANVISPLILGAGLLTWLALEQVEPMRSHPGYAVLTRIVDALPLVVAPTLPLAFWAIFIRIDQYGWTEFRYLRVAALGVLTLYCALGIVGFFRRRPLPPWVAPLLVSATALLSALGPLSAPALTQRSQLARFEALVHAQELLDDRGALDLDRLKSAPQKSNEAIRSYLYLSHHFGPSLLKSYRPDDIDAEQWASLLYELRWNTPEHDPTGVRVIQAQTTALRVERAAIIYPLHHMPSPKASVTTIERPGQQALRVSFEGSTLLVDVEGQELRAELEAMITQHAERHDLLPAPNARVILRAPDNTRRGELVVETLHLQRGDEGFVPTNLLGSLILED
ncbi:hypothetical protein DL240_13710 [Lujinxingia litoralis]|uniref:DUF4153 domain-containing protein n=1 Tax=Lujinxingia litoralis TaxID=2211119 RepID=A0A328C465_9DELT|nr:DUF4153 domain-containing protein [Lujinxingia litoralis]RAL21184.1 hypothetical protein DL240_13710 [Lujinxingia litoralis]